MNNASLSLTMAVHLENTGERIEVSEDSDGLGLLELRFLDENGKLLGDMRLPPQHADLLIRAIRDVSLFLQSMSRDGLGRQRALLSEE